MAPSATSKPCEKYKYVVTPAGPKILPVLDQESKDEESAAEYAHGGYLPVKVNDTFKDGRYTVIRKLGWGHFSTVWLVFDNSEKRHSALKVVKSAARYAETARDEISLLNSLARANPRHPGLTHVVSFLDSFSHPSPHAPLKSKPNDPAMHVCIVFEPLGENLLALIERHKKKGVPPRVVKIIARQVLLGLQYLHDECELVHTDIKPENIMISIPDVEAHIASSIQAAQPTSRRVSVPLQATARHARHVHIFDSQPLASPKSSSSLESRSSSDSVSTFTPASVAASTPPTSIGSSIALAMSCKPDDKSAFTGIEAELQAALTTSFKDASPGGPSLLSQTAPKDPHRAPSPPRAASPPPPPSEPSGPPPPITIKIADLGNATPRAAHYTEDIQTRQYRAPEAIVGRRDWDSRADVWSLACVVFELLTAEYLFDPQGQGALFTKDDDHVAQIIELMGDWPLDAKMGGRYSRDLFDATGALRYIHTLKPWPLKRVMMEKYAYDEQAAEALCAFLEPMLAPDPRRRVEARDMVDHPWLRDEDAGADLEW
ncbi:hypothetical protein PLICRDRAFT_35946 [Plicaturopsis crispa FD-325 SS-3]|nr:hypothetical protein PLICRDRAFT_35946 [Plicaturopsis crispa FD-325 SS-3]